MRFKETYRLELPKSSDFLTHQLKDLCKEEIRNDDNFYSLEFSWDEFIVTAKAKIFQRTTFTADASIRLTGLSEDLTRADIEIKFSAVTWCFLVLVQLGIFVTCLFVAEFNWLIRIGLLISISGIWAFIVWLTFIRDSRALKQVINHVFTLTEEKA